MAMIRQRGSKYELRVRHRLLPKTFYATFDSELAARNYGEQLEALLSQGMLPLELAAPRMQSLSSATLAKLIRDYRLAAPVSALDAELLDLLLLQIGSQRIHDVLTYKWAEQWIRTLKIERNLAPGTIRKRVGALARLLDWHLKREVEESGHRMANPLRLLPKNYSTYNDHEQHLVARVPGKVVKEDIERERRLLADEEVRIVASLRGEKHPDRERPLALPDGDALLDLYFLLVNTGLRLREAYILRVRDVHLETRTLHIRRSKTGVARDVPIIPEIHHMLQRRMSFARHGPDSPLFPWWSASSDRKELKRITALLSGALARAFAYAKCEDLTVHDLRHEATCRWILMRDLRGGWLFRSEEVMRITGHKDPRMFMRYVSLRGSDLAERLWPTPP